MPHDDSKTPAVERTVASLIQAESLLEGGGFPVRRPFPGPALMDADPFLLLDHMGPVEWAPGEAIGAPAHPHRGFETVTYMLEGKMQHKDSHGHQGDIGPGDVQWMTAGSGVLHSELPEADFKRRGGIMHGLQLWVNLPAKKKMVQPRYQEIPAAQIPQGISADGLVKVRVIAGEAMGHHAAIDTHTPIVYLHYTLQPGGRCAQQLASEYNALIYTIAGKVLIGPDKTPVLEGHAALLGQGTVVTLANQETVTTDLIVLAGIPLKEPIARYGPFVMNTQSEIRQAITDFHQGRMGRLDT